MIEAPRRDYYFAARAGRAVAAGWAARSGLARRIAVGRGDAGPAGGGSA